LHLSSHERYNPVSSDEWFQSLISSELVMTDPITPLVPFDRKLQLLIDDERPQEGFEVAPHPLEWVFGEEDGFSQRLLKDHPHQMYISSLFSRFGVAKTEQNSSLIQIFRKEGGLSLFWGGVQLHSLFVPSGKREGDFLTFDLVQPLDSSKEEREVLFFVDRSIETELFINGKKGTVFELGDLILIQTAEIEIEAVFTLVKGEGDFRGQISRGNRPSQISNTAERLYEAFDWMIALRSLRRTTPCQLRLALRCCHPHRVQSVVDVEHLSCDC
jgi:hypothetical protein